MASFFQTGAKMPNKASGHLYHYKSGLSHGEVLISPVLKTRIRRVQHVFGIACVSFAMAVMLYSYAPVYHIPLGESQNLGVIQAQEPMTVNENINTVQKETSAFGISSDFSIAVPKIVAYSNVIQDVSPFDSNEYQAALKEGVAHASGTGFPGENKRMFIFAHSTNSILNFDRYNAIFYELRKLTPGDSIYIYYKGERFTYKVFDSKSVSARDVSWLTPTEEPVVILQTCDPPGTTWKRLLVFARLEK